MLIHPGENVPMVRDMQHGGVSFVRTSPVRKISGILTLVVLKAHTARNSL